MQDALKSSQAQNHCSFNAKLDMY